MAEAYAAGVQVALAQQRARLAAAGGQSAASLRAERERQREHSLQQRRYLLHQHPECFTHPGAPLAGHQPD